ncbi:MAG: filamentous hemagglutinin N-terminal domain-containing protein [Nostoc sp. ChiSLP01]|nr:filamentous hemagglutinin N-terminal domain-containing protein [Nostoc sp. CmiSLP01]MDZ8289089.1 filamentous hemagglutinin N-terminal domain-containing protein [Nostoc sp. ChiSLP01]
MTPSRRNRLSLKLSLLNILLITGVTVFCGDCVNAQIIPDRTLTSESSTVTVKTINGKPIIEIDSGAIRGTNLFHSFKEFSVSTGSTAYFNNAVNIQNIISRVTGNSVSNIDGILKANGTANLFLINPNGIIFGSNASLNIGGSFLVSTASRLNFADGTKFSAKDPQTTPLLTVSVPIGLQFGLTAAPIRNQSQANPNVARNPIGLQVQSSKTLAFVGGDITLEGGNLTAASGQIELGSVAGNSLVNLNPTNQGWNFGYEGVENFQNIQIIARTGNSSNFLSSQVDTTNTDSIPGNIQLQANSVELIGGVRLTSQSRGVGRGGNLTINTRKLIIRDGAQVTAVNTGMGKGGTLTVNASESVELIGSSVFNRPSGLFNYTTSVGNGGDITINTRRLRVEDGGQISTGSTGQLFVDLPFIAASGNGGNLNVNASEAVELIGRSATSSSSLSASTLGSGNAGQVRIATRQLIIRDGAEVSVSSQISPNLNYSHSPLNLGAAGNIDVSAGSIRLDNQGKLIAESQSGQNGNIRLQVQDLLLMRRNSLISAYSGNAANPGNDGNVTINATNGFIFAAPLENSDIVTNSFFGSGGQIQILAAGIYGFVLPSRADLIRLLQSQDPEQLTPSTLPSSDIIALSQQNSLSGKISNAPVTELLELPKNLVDTSQKITSNCEPGGKFRNSPLNVTGRGGIPSNPLEPLTSDAVLADWITLEPKDTNDINNIYNRAAIHHDRHTQDLIKRVNSVNSFTQIVEAQGWVVDSKGNVVLVAEPSTATLHDTVLNRASCIVSDSQRS